MMMITTTQAKIETTDGPKPIPNVNVELDRSP